MTSSLGLEKGGRQGSAASLLLSVCAGAAAIVVAAGVATFTAFGPTPKGTIYDRQLQQAFANRQEMLAAALPMLRANVAGHSVEIRDCADFLSAARFWDVRAAWVGDPRLTAYTSCVPLQLLAVGRPPKTFLAPKDELGRLVAERLDLASLDDGTVAALLPHDLRHSLGDVPRLAKLPAGAVTVEPRAVAVEAGGVHWRLEVVASLDLGRSGVENLLLRITRNSVGQGEPNGVGYAVLQQGADGCLRALSAERLTLPLTPLPWVGEWWFA